MTGANDPRCTCGVEAPCPYHCTCERGMRALENLTPSGSEFTLDPERCVEFIERERKAEHNALLRVSLELSELRRRILTEKR